MANKKSLSNPIHGLVHITGEHDTGKTDFALSCGYQPEEMFIVDDDIKTGVQINRIGKNHFPMYHNFVNETKGMKELDLHAHGLKLIAEIEQKKPKVIIWDTWTRFAKTCHPYVVAHASDFRQFWSHQGTIKGAEQWKASFIYEGTLIERMLQATSLILLITHLKAHNLNGVKTGKMIPDAQPTLTEKASLRLWLRHNPNSPKPIGLVLKRIEKFLLTDEGLEPVAVLPRRIVPCTWKKIYEYWDNPIGDRQPTPEETPNEFELSILDETLTPDQKDVLKLGAISSTASADEVALELPLAVAEDVNRAKAQVLAGEGKSKIAIAKELGATVIQVSQWLKE